MHGRHHQGDSVAKGSLLLTPDPPRGRVAQAKPYRQTARSVLQARLSVLQNQFHLPWGFRRCVRSTALGLHATEHRDSCSDSSQAQGNLSQSRRQSQQTTARLTHISARATFAAPRGPAHELSAWIPLTLHVLTAAPQIGCLPAVPSALVSCGFSPIDFCVVTAGLEASGNTWLSDLVATPNRPSPQGLAFHGQRKLNEHSDASRG